VAWRFWGEGYPLAAAAGIRGIGGLSLISFVRQPNKSLDQKGLVESICMYLKNVH
jgi:hypothetical protein